MRHSNRQGGKSSSAGSARKPAAGSRRSTASKAGMPRFLNALPTNPHAESEARAGESASTNLQTSTESRAIARQIDSGAGAGQAVPDSVQHEAGEQARVHTDDKAQTFAGRLGARAVTVGRNIFFGAGEYAPHTQDGEKLLQHELTHVAQQRGEPQALQCDTHASMPATLGVFGVDTTTAVVNGNPGMNVNLSFEPDPFGPYSTQIGMVQLVNTTDARGTTAAAGGPVDWGHVGAGEEAGRQEAMTTGAGSAGRGWFVDAFYDPAVHPRSSNVSPNYQEPDVTNPTPGGYGDYGWLRSPTDWHAATLIDSPNMSFDTDFDFQTFARGADNQQIYGALEWGFTIRGGAVTSDYARAATSSGAEFGEAMERFQGYFSHEDVVIYFDTDVDTPNAAEAAKLTDARDYMDRYPDARIELTGYADRRGETGYNRALSGRRAGSVHALLLAQGIDAGRIGTDTASGETTAFAPGSPAAAAGSLQANRRVVVRFVRTAEAPINAP